MWPFPLGLSTFFARVLQSFESFSCLKHKTSRSRAQKADATPDQAWRFHLLVCCSSFPLLIASSMRGPRPKTQNHDHFFGFGKPGKSGRAVYRQARGDYPEERNRGRTAAKCVGIRMANAKCEGTKTKRDAHVLPALAERGRAAEATGAGTERRNGNST